MTREFDTRALRPLGPDRRTLGVMVAPWCRGFMPRMPRLLWHPNLVANKKPPLRGGFVFLEARTGFEPVMKALQASALPLGHLAVCQKGPAEDDRPRVINGADNGVRTRDPHLGKVMLYQLSHVRVARRYITRSKWRMQGKVSLFWDFLK